MARINVIPLTQANASGLFSTVQQLAARAGLPEQRIFMEHPFLNFGNQFGRINAAAIGGNRIVFTPGILRLFGCTDWHAVPDQKFQAILAHELYHCKHFYAKGAAMYAPLFLLPLASVLGWHLYTRAKDKKNCEEKHKAIDEGIAHITETVEKKTGAKPKIWQERAIHTAKYLAVAALGLGVGYAATAGMSRFFEFRADAFSKQLMGGNGQPLADAIRIIQQDAISHAQRHGTPGDISLWQKIIGKVLSTHPSYDARITSLLR
jgi:Zn-dependent protease with chaperone function